MSCSQMASTVRASAGVKKPHPPAARPRVRPSNEPATATETPAPRIVRRRTSGSRQEPVHTLGILVDFVLRSGEETDEHAIRRLDALVCRAESLLYIAHAAGGQDFERETGFRGGPHHL